MAQQIRMRDLFYIYENSGEKIVALRGLDLTVELGECLAIRGPNGSGKSTLVKLLTGYQAPTAGAIYIDGLDIATIDSIRLRREFVASVDQAGNLIRELTVLENLEVALSLAGSAEAATTAARMLEEHDSSHLAAKYPHQLSAGERQYLSLLAAIATDPKVLVADEPSAELDDAAARVIYNLLAELSKTKIVILVTHDPRAEEYATRTVRIREGRISEEWMAGEPEQSVIDEFGWTRVRESLPEIPVRSAGSGAKSEEALLRVKDLDLTYGERKVFSELSFTAFAGQLVVLDSTNSTKSGKSSLLRILAGLQDPTAGEVRIAEEIVGGLDREARAEFRSRTLSYLPQRGNALQLVTLGEYLHNSGIFLPGALGARTNTPLGNFSGGERARIELMRIIAKGRSILLLDEPTSQMDDKRSLEMVDALFSYLGRGGLVVASTRNEILLQVADLTIELS